LVHNLKTNLARSQSRVRVFEMAKVFYRDASVVASEATVPNIAQPLKLAGLTYGAALPEQWNAPSADVDFYDMKNELERLFAPAVLSFVPFAHVAAHPGRCAQVVLAGQTIGWLGQLHPRLQQKHGLAKAPMLFELDAQSVLARSLPVAMAVSKQQMVTRDLALIVAKQVDSAQVSDSFAQFIALEGGANLIRGVQLFDVYQGERLGNDKSMAYRISLQDMNETLQDAQVDAVMSRLLTKLQADVGARLR
jgi:phenylalanyl-tRNA synthetase beta chain